MIRNVLLFLSLLVATGLSAQEEGEAVNIDDLINRSTSYNPNVAIECNERLYSISQEITDNKLAFFSAMNLARKYFLLVNPDKRIYWDEKAREALRLIENGDGLWTKAYEANSQLWNGDSTYYERISMKDVLDLCNTNRSIIASLFRTMPERGIRMCDAIMQRCIAENDTVSIPFFNACVSKGLLANDAGDRASATAHFRRALQTQREYIGAYFPYMTEDDRHYVWEACFDHAFSIAEQAVLTEKMWNMELMYDAYDQLLLSKSVRLTTSNFVRREIAKDSALSRQWKQLADMRSRLATTQMSADERSRMLSEAANTERAIMANVGSLAANDMAYVSGRDLQKALKPGEVAVEFFQTSDSCYLAMLLSSIYPSPLIVPVDEARNVIRLQDTDYAVNQDMYAKVWSMVLLLCPDTKSIYFSPTGMLQTMPIEHCMTNDGRYMSERFNMYRLTSTREIIALKSNPRYASATIYGGILYDASTKQLAADAARYKRRASSAPLHPDVMRDWREYVEPLENTVTEADNISKILRKQKARVKLYKEANASEASLKALSGNSPDILHIATHAFFWNEAQSSRYSDLDFMKATDNRLLPFEDKALTRSGLLMAGASNTLKGDSLPLGMEDGVCTSAEVSRLDLSNTDLVVLSACNTARGDLQGDGVFGLQRGFKKAGVNSILMSLWPVNDKATMLLMTEFYRNITMGKSKTESLRIAQQFLRNYNNGCYKDKEHWAGFIIVDAM